MWTIKEQTFKQKRIKIYFIGDKHEGHEESDTPALLKTVKQIAKERNSYVILMGDLIEMAIKTNMTDSQIFRTQHQLATFIHTIRPILHKVIAVIEGNHERRIETIDYLNDALMLHLPNAVYLGYEGFLNIKQRVFHKDGCPEHYNTLIYLHHGTGGSQNPEYFLKKLIFQVGIGGIADVIAVAHIHQQYHNTYTLPKIEGRQVTERIVHGIRTGAYLGNADYAKVAGFGLSRTGGMILELDARSGKLERKVTKT